MESSKFEHAAGNFLKKLLRNLLFLMLLVIILYMIFPSQIASVFELYGALFGPLALLLMISAALPGKRSR